MSLTLLNRIDIDIDWYFSAISLGFTIHKRGFQLSFIFVDINICYTSLEWRQLVKNRYKRYLDKVDNL